MKQVRKEKVKGFASVLHTLMIIDDKAQWKKIYCPLSASAEGDPCGEWCAWYDEENLSGKRWARCKGSHIGEIVEAP
jgi:hypothetical protein